MSLPLILNDKDVIGQAKTGSGKTAAFGLGLLNKLKVKEFRVQTLILCPPRELADQVAKELRRLARAGGISGTGSSTQLPEVRRAGHGIA